MPATPPLPVGSERGQAAVEYITTLVVVAALALGLAAALGARPARALVDALTAGLLGGHAGHAPDRGPAALFDDLPAATQRYVLAAVDGRGDGTGPTTGDAAQRLATALGDERAARVLEAVAVTRVPATHPGEVFGRFTFVAFGDLLDRGSVLGSGAVPSPGGDRYYGEVEPRPGPARAHLVDADDERRALAAVHARRTRDLRVRGLVRLAVEGGLTFLEPWLAVPIAGADLLDGVLADTGVQSVPPGMRRDDLVLCLPVRVVNVIRDPVERERIRASRPDVYAQLDLGRAHDMTRLVTIRSGRVIAAVTSRATSCG